MENFFIEENFFMDLDSLISHLDLDDNGAVEALEEDWTIEIELSELEPIFQLDEKYVVEAIMLNTDSFEERWPEDDDGDTAENIKKAIKASVDLDKLNSLLPKLYYPTGKFEEITKQDLLEYIR